jgi:hypothetical protein
MLALDLTQNTVIRTIVDSIETSGFLQIVPPSDWW